MTVVVPRLGKTSFIDSPDAMCERNGGHAIYAQAHFHETDFL